MESREFVITVRRRWTLWILPVIALLYFVAVMFLAVTGQRVRGVETRMLVLAGAALFGLVLLIQLPFLLTRRAREPEAAEPREEPSPYAPAEMGAPPVAAPAAAARDDEFVATNETQKGLRVLEYSAPAKSANKGAVYAKTYVPVTKEHVLRVETVAADRHEI